MKDNLKSYLVPTVVEETNRGERAFDIYSRLFRAEVCTMVWRFMTR